MTKGSVTLYGCSSHDGRLGFGGACFPKDTEAIVKYADEIG